MEDPFFLNYWNAPRPRPRFSPNPIHQQDHPPKVVSIPVRFVESERARSEAATKIQKLYRGFAVRKNVKKIAKIRSQVDNVQHQISQKSDLIARDAKERLRLNETLMSLLFQLDSVRGVDPAVRDCRKAVIRRAIALQEAIDAIVEKKETETVADSIDQTLEKTGIPVESATEPKLEMQNPVESATADEPASEIQYPAEETVDDVPETETETPIPVVNQCSEGEDQTLEAVQDPSGSEASGIVDDEAPETESSDEKSMKKLEEDDEEGIIPKADMLLSPKEADLLVEEDVVERVMEENEKLRGLVMELCERNAEQSRLIELLSQRVDQLEKTVARCERIRKKKKRCDGKLEREIQRRKCERRL
ncbi:nuclear autoantigenic sperm-like protein [Cinnamomum micranthum f. kanehirae]|uniref:Nuclear autoantigenic sperm-like protein n=1 Tax=Cinnamomum micranthum f. kanehirae TaxID=337451 RepID=A0A3S3NUV0_9MAGN|nr:nuclear autoantigenic sperm-like protein [Cinnamomum micranthum f. kanehirae]